MDIHIRLEANAIIDRLVMDGATFSSNDARRLIELIPVAPSTRLSFKGSVKSRGSGFKGHAAGIGDVEMKGETKEKTLSLNVPTSHKIGGYIVTHTPGSIGVELMWGETQPDQTGQSCSLVYDVKTGEPQEMLLASQKSLSLLFFTFSYVSFVPWKKPEHGSTS
ncbi:hypothetical protein [Microvirga rosea]|uniref:hypothetical protein n=1 Tax=Microvirga rosea TaxID=2715425 RepID=UPI001D0A1449|nr:hypothetical protein [Microvirga rosea]MCB8823314.1 hypothetical protein [Microvirga rosea]